MGATIPRRRCACRQGLTSVVARQVIFKNQAKLEQIYITHNTSYYAVGVVINCVAVVYCTDVTVNCTDVSVTFQ